MTDKSIGTVEYDATSASILAGEAKAALAATDILIDSDAMLAIAGDDLRAIKGLQKRVEEKRVGITSPLNHAVKAVNDLFRAPKDYLDQAERTLKASILRYSQEQEAIAADQRRRAEEGARIERERLLSDQREQEAIYRKAQECSNQAREDAAAAAGRGDALAAALAKQCERQQAAIAETAQEQADAAALTAEVITMPVAIAGAAKIVGVSGRVTYTAVVEDLLSLVRAVADGDAPAQCLQADEKFLGAQARAFKSVGTLYPGVASIAERSLAARAGR